MATAPPPQPMQAAPIDEGPPGGKGMLRLGCATFIIGLVLAAAGVAGNKLSDAGDAWYPIGVIGGVLLLCSFGYFVAVGLVINRRSIGRAREGFAFAQQTQPDPDVVRRLEASRLPATANWARFPTNIVANARIFRGDTPITLSVNVPKLVTRGGRHKPMELPTCYVWMPLPVALPRLIVRPDTRDGALLGRDIDIENEEFNRRFRIDSDPPGTNVGPAKVRYEDFAPYAHALLHPRAAQALLRLPDINGLVIDGDLIGVLDRPYTSQARVDQIVDALLEFVALMPTHVLNRWGGQPGYRPRG